MADENTRLHWRNDTHRSLGWEDRQGGGNASLRGLAPHQPLLCLPLPFRPRQGPTPKWRDGLSAIPQAEAASPGQAENLWDPSISTRKGI